MIKSLARRYVASSSPVRQNLIVNHGIDPSLIELIPVFHSYRRVNRGKSRRLPP